MAERDAVTVMIVDDRTEESLIADVCRLVRIPSRSSSRGGEEGDLQRVIAEEMRRGGARVRTFEPDDVPAFRAHPLCHGPDREYAGRPTVIGEIGPGDAPALLILAHSDTVQVNRPEEWTFDPFCGEVREGKICGLGACDDKWGLAVMLAILQNLQAAGRRLDKKLVFASTVDEEHGVGNGTLLLTLAGVKAEAALYLDGYQGKVLIGNLGGSNLYLRAKGEVTKEEWDRHAKGLESACRQFSLRRGPLFVQDFFRDNMVKGESVFWRQRTDEGVSFFDIGFYLLPGEEGQGFCRELEDVVAEALGNDRYRYALSYRQPWFEPSIIPEDTPLVRHVSAAVEEVLGRKAHVTTISKQDNFVLNNYAKIPTVSFGPRQQVSGPGTFHQVDEYITIEELWSGFQVAYRAVSRWLGEGVG